MGMCEGEGGREGEREEGEGKREVERGREREGGGRERRAGKRWAPESEGWRGRPVKKTRMLSARLCVCACAWLRAPARECVREGERGREGGGRERAGPLATRSCL